MFLIKSATRRHRVIQSFFSLVFVAGAAAGVAQTNLPLIKIQADKVVAKMPPTFYGLMTEEINFAYEGGLYGELIRNRSFKADGISATVKAADYDAAKYYPVHFPASTNVPKFWSAVGSAQVTLDTNNVLNEMLNVSCLVEAKTASKETPAGLANGGYWGIPVRPNTTYRASLFARAKEFAGALTISLESADGKTVFAKSTIPGIESAWKQYETTLTTGGDIAESKSNRLVVTVSEPGSLWLQQVSLMPPTFKGRANGNRVDLSELLDAAHPKFLRFPGGNYVEGQTFPERFNWKQMVGPQEKRPGHRSCWGYWSTDGFGLPEFLGWCQDLGMEPVLAVFAGYTLNREHVTNSAALKPYVEEALEEIEYVIGDASTKWGAQRINDGYPNPFPLRYVEIGNEDWFDRSGSYEWRFADFYDAIRAKYPNLKIISTMGYEHPEFVVKSRTPDLVDEHYYQSEEAMEHQSFKYDTYDRSRPAKVFVGEWATRVGSPTPNMAGALGDAAWMCCMERNADIVLMHCYAPLFVNVSQTNGMGRSMQWSSDLIGYDALNSYGSPSYYAQKIFSNLKGDEVLAISAQDLPTYSWIQRNRTRNGQVQPPTTNEVKSVFYSATRDTANHKMFVKVVNRDDSAHEVRIQIEGAGAITDQGTATVLKADKRTETNSIDNPKHILPVVETISGLSADFKRSFPPCSITILELSLK